MRKEIIIAIVAGVSFGAVIAFGIWRANVALKPTDENSSIATEETSESEISASHQISLSEPEELDVITQAPTKFTGITKPDSWVVISSDDNDYLTRSNSDGEFETDIELIGGLNRITLSSFDTNGAKAETAINVVFSTEFEEGVNSKN